MNKLVFDIGATNTKFALMSSEGKIIAREKIRTDYSSAEKYYENLSSIAHKYKDDADAIAISTNGRMDLTNEIYRAYTVGVICGTNLKTEMKKRTGLPVHIINDGFAAALGEFHFGAGRGSKNMIGIVLGSGMGGGIIIDGKIYNGSKNNAAMVFGMVNSFEPKNTDLAGVSTSFALLLYKYAVAKQLSPESVTGDRFFEFYHEGDPIAVTLLNSYCKSVATTAYNSAMLFDPDSIVVTGGLSERAEIIDGINNSLRDIVASFSKNQDVGMLLSAANVDFNDFTISVKKGELALDANLYGAFQSCL